jgi:hypothetical protein
VVTDALGLLEHGTNNRSHRGRFTFFDSSRQPIQSVFFGVNPVDEDL